LIILFYGTIAEAVVTRKPNNLICTSCAQVVQIIRLTCDHSLSYGTVE